MTLVANHLVCVGREHSKAASVIAVSAFERRTAAVVASPAYAGCDSERERERAAAPVWTFFQIFEPLGFFFLRHLNWPLGSGEGGGSKSSTTRAFQVSQTNGQSRTLYFNVDFQLCAGAGGGLSPVFGQNWCQCVWLEQQSHQSRSPWSSTWSGTTGMWTFLWQRRRGRDQKKKTS